MFSNTLGEISIEIHELTGDRACVLTEQRGVDFHFLGAAFLRLLPFLLALDLDTVLQVLLGLHASELVGELLCVAVSLLNFDNILINLVLLVAGFLLDPFFLALPFDSLLHVLEFDLPLHEASALLAL